MTYAEIMPFWAVATPTLAATLLITLIHVKGDRE